MAAGPVDPGASGGTKETSTKRVRNQPLASSRGLVGRTGVRSLDRAAVLGLRPRRRAEGP
eukprot:8820284-Alexandrium_andersonii.AAC.1